MNTATPGIQRAIQKNQNLLKQQYTPSSKCYSRLPSSSACCTVCYETRFGCSAQPSSVNPYTTWSRTASCTTENHFFSHLPTKNPLLSKISVSEIHIFSSFPQLTPTLFQRCVLCFHIVYRIPRWKAEGSRPPKEAPDIVKKAEPHTLHLFRTYPIYKMSTRAAAVGRF